MSEKLINIARGVNDRIILSSNSKRAFDLPSKWQRSVDFLEGRQWGTPMRSVSQETFRRKIEYEDRRKIPKATFNVIRHDIRAIVAKILVVMRKLVAIPTDMANPELVDSARIGTKILEHLGRDINNDEIKLSILTWALVTGVIFKKHTWNPRVGSVIKDKKNKDRRLNLGKIEIDVVSPLNISIDPSAVFGKDIRWLIETIDMVEEEAMELVPEDLRDNVKGKSTDSLSNSNDGDDRAKVQKKILWELPSDKYQDGRHLVLIGDVVIGDEKQIMPYNVIPYVKYQFSIGLGTFWGDGLVSDLEMTQKSLNKLLSRLLIAADRLATPVWLNPRGSGVTNFNNSVGVHDYNAGYAPHQSMPMPMGSSIQEAIGQMRRMQFDITQMQPVSRGLSQTDIRSGRQTSMLQEANATTLLPTIRLMYLSEMQSGEILLELARKHWNEERMVITGGKNSDYDVKKFKGSDIKEGMRVCIEGGLEIPLSSAAKQSFVLELVRAGVLRDTDKIFEFAEFGTPRTFFHQNELEARKARMENEEMEKTGTPAIVNKYDKDPIHEKEHLESYQLSDKGKEVKEQHIRMHRENAVNKQIEMDDYKLRVQLNVMAKQQQMQQGGMMQGAPPPTV